MSGFIIRAGGQTSQGKREENEDRFAIDEERRIYVVADGMGGAGNGARAAELAVTVLPQELWDWLDQRYLTGAALQWGIAQAHRAVQKTVGESEMGLQAGATIVVAFWHGDELFIGWVGDCRAYRISDGKNTRLTEDHTVRAALIRSGRMTEEQARRSRIRNTLTAYLGGPELPEHPFQYHASRPRKGDRIILATDGLYQFCKEHELLAACQASPDPQECANHLVEHALRRGSRDNVTGVVLAFEPVKLHPGWLTWNGGMVGQLVRVIEQEHAFHLLPVLGDALEEAGCTNADILEHCHRPGTHGGGCWVLELLSRQFGATEG